MKVIYTPLENGDPVDTVFAGFKFHAGDPVDIPESATVNILERVTSKNPEGLIRGEGIEKKSRVIDVLKANPYFKIEGQEAPKKKAGRPANPKTPEEYRAYAQAWIASAQTPEDLTERWQRDEVLRERIGIPEDGDEIKFLRLFFEGKFHELTKVA